MTKIKQFILVFLTSGSFFSQVGINTSNPQGIFHIDGNKDNPSTGMFTRLLTYTDPTTSTPAKYNIVSDGLAKPSDYYVYDSSYFGNYFYAIPID